MHCSIVNTFLVIIPLIITGNIEHDRGKGNIMYNEFGGRADENVPHPTSTSKERMTTMHAFKRCGSSKHGKLLFAEMMASFIRMIMVRFSQKALHAQYNHTSV